MIDKIKCQWHTCQKEAIRKFCSKKCSSKYHVDKRRKSLKYMAVEYLGGSCKRCGWKEHQCGLVPHHLNPNTKEYSLGLDGNTRSWSSIKLELDKCVLLCSNCHHVVHALNLIEWFDKEYINSETKFKEILQEEIIERKPKIRKIKETKPTKPKSELEILLGFK